MANLSETATYDAGVYQLETSDPVQGGSSGVSNAPLKNLANRTAYLKQHVDSLESLAGGLAPTNSPAFTGSPNAPTQALGDNSTLIATDAFVQATVGGLLNKSVAGGSNVTLTAVEAGNAILNLTGALTANISVIVPTAPTRSWIIKNATSGAYTLTVKTASGTGVVCSQGTNAVVWTDGTNVYDALTDFDSIALIGTPTAPTVAAGDATTKIANMAAVSNATDGMATVSVTSGADVTLTAAQYGMAILNVTGTPSANINLLFPAQSGVWVVKNNQVGSFNVTAKVVSSSGTTKVLPQNGSAVVVYSDGTNIEFASSATSSQAAFNMVPITGVTGTTLAIPGGYTPGLLFIEKNGALLQPADYTATNGSSATLVTAAVSTDKFTAYVFNSFTVANAVMKSGDTMTGALVLYGNAANALEAVPKQQLDAAIAGISIPDASTTVKGKVQIATNSESLAMTDALKALTPAALAYALSIRVGHTFSANDWAPLPGGLIIQWGNAGSGVYDGSVTFPIAFTSAVYGVLTTSNYVGGAATSCVNSQSTTGFNYVSRYGSGTPQTMAFNWIAIGK